MQFLSPVGWIFTVTLTYSGFILLAVGALWNANIVRLSLRSLQISVSAATVHWRLSVVWTAALIISSFLLRQVAKLKKLSAKCRELKEARAKLDESAEGNRSAKASVAGSEATEVSEVAFDFGAPQEEECED